MRFGPPFQVAQIRSAPAFRYSYPRSRDNLL
jgi:hypothetical protein